MSSARRVATLALTVITAGCTDTTKPDAAVTEPALSPHQTSTQQSGSQATPDGLGPEWEGTTYANVTVYAGFRSEAVSPDEGVPGNARPYAWGLAMMGYFGNEADLSVSLVARKGGSEVASAQQSLHPRDLLPWYRSTTAKTEVFVPAPCGHSAHATGTGAAWNKALIPPVGWFEWGRKQGSATDQGFQPACQSGAPGGNGSDAPPDDPDRSGCGWVRNFTIYMDMSWEYTTPWYHSCGPDDDLLLTPNGPTEIVRSMASTAGGTGRGGAPLRLTLVGTRSPANGRIVTIERNAKSKADAVITVDVTQATAADLEEAFVAAEGLSLKAKPKDARSSYGRIVSEPSAVSRAASGEGSRAAKNLSALLRAGDRGKNGDGARIEVVVDRR